MKTTLNHPCSLFGVAFIFCDYFLICFGYMENTHKVVLDFIKEIRSIFLANGENWSISDQTISVQKIFLVSINSNNKVLLPVLYVLWNSMCCCKKQFNWKSNGIFFCFKIIIVWQHFKYNTINKRNHHKHFFVLYFLLQEHSYENNELHPKSNYVKSVFVFHKHIYHRPNFYFFRHKMSYASGNKRKPPNNKILVIQCANRDIQFRRSGVIKGLSALTGTIVEYVAVVQ